jgi:hypothetical protein
MLCVMCACICRILWSNTCVHATDNEPTRFGPSHPSASKLTSACATTVAKPKLNPKQALKKAIRAICSIAQDPTNYWCERLHHALSGLDDDKSLIRTIVSRAEVDLMTIEAGDPSIPHDPFIPHVPSIPHARLCRVQYRSPLAKCARVNVCTCERVGVCTCARVNAKPCDPVCIIRVRALFFSTRCLHCVATCPFSDVRFGWWAHSTLLM